MFNSKIDLKSLNDLTTGNLSGHVGIEYIEIGSDYLIAKMPVDERTIQPAGILHGGASVVLAETLGSVASFYCLDPEQKKLPVGLEISANHIKSVSSGWVYGKVTPKHIGRRTHLWQIEITNDDGQLVCLSKITVMII